MLPKASTSWKRLSDNAPPSVPLQRWETEGGRTARARGPVRILIVDNDIGSAESLENMLHASGFSETSVAYSGHAALTLSREFRPDVVLLDMDLFDMTAYELAQSLRAQAQSDDIRLIALTSSPQHTAREQARVAGFERYLVKPIAAGDLSALLDSSLT